MKHTKEEILKALHVIKDTCYESSQKKDGVFTCYECPFNDGDGHCIVNEQAPCVWNIKSDEPWRAFE